VKNQLEVCSPSARVGSVLSRPALALRMMYRMQRITPHRLLSLALLLLSSMMHAQQPNGHPSKRSRFTSPDGKFHFEFSTSLIQCHRDPGNEDVWEPDACSAYTPICPDAIFDTVACVAYPAQPGTNLEGAAFSVSELKQVTNQEECLKVAKPPPHVGRARNEIINKIPFNVTEIDGVAVGNFLYGYVYRTFHRKLCYELSIRVASFNLANADPGTVKDFDQEAARRTLQSVLESFGFLK
jgi:hypothetical protein